MRIFFSSSFLFLFLFGHSTIAAQLQPGVPDPSRYLTSRFMAAERRNRTDPRPGTTIGWTAEYSGLGPDTPPETLRPEGPIHDRGFKSLYRPLQEAQPHFPVDDSSNLKVEPDNAEYPRPEGFRWGPAIRQSLLFLGVQHGYAMTQPKTRRALKGPFLRDYAKSVKSLSGWGDGGKFFTNYIAHPMQGSLTGFIYVQNDPRGAGQSFSGSGKYWKSRMKALAWSAAWSTQFEIGPISQASLGNVGLSGKQTYVDLVITPTVGTAMLIGEDILDKYVVQPIEGWSGNRLIRIFMRMILNPTRSVANLIQFKKPWYRDRALRL